MLFTAEYIIGCWSVEMYIDTLCGVDYKEGYWWWWWVWLDDILWFDGWCADCWHILDALVSISAGLVGLVVVGGDVRGDDRVVVLVAVWYDVVAVIDREDSVVCEDGGGVVGGL